MVVLWVVVIWYAEAEAALSRWGHGQGTGRYEGCRRWSAFFRWGGRPFGIFSETYGLHLRGGEIVVVSRVFGVQFRFFFICRSCELVWICPTSVCKFGGYARCGISSRDVDHGGFVAELLWEYARYWWSALF